jgi:hypothetical protein
VTPFETALAIFDPIDETVLTTLVAAFFPVLYTFLPKLSVSCPNYFKEYYSIRFY